MSTHNHQLWLTNDEGTYRYALEVIGETLDRFDEDEREEAIAGAMSQLAFTFQENAWEEAREVIDGSGWRAEALSHWLESVDWHEIAGYYRESAQEIWSERYDLAA